MSPSNNQRRSWKEVAMDLIGERDHRRFTDLAEELNEALAARGLGDNWPNHQSGHNPYRLFITSDWTPDLLTSAVKASAADCGTLQFLDSSQQALRIAAHDGFGQEFLKYFETVRCGDSCACGTAMTNGSRVFVADVASDPLFQPGPREVLLQAGVCSVQSTPLRSAAGDFIGVLSTHYRQPRSFSSVAWDGLDDVVARYMAKIAVTGCSTT